jgi:hypothetical protein
MNLQQIEAEQSAIAAQTFEITELPIKGNDELKRSFDEILRKEEQVYREGKDDVAVIEYSSARSNTNQTCFYTFSWSRMTFHSR